MVVTEIRSVIEFSNFYKLAPMDWVCCWLWILDVVTKILLISIDDGQWWFSTEDMMVRYGDIVKSKAWYGDINWFVDTFRNRRLELLWTWYKRQVGVSMIEYCCCCCWRGRCRAGDSLWVLKRRAGDPRWILLVLEGETSDRRSAFWKGRRWAGGRFALSIADAAGVWVFRFEYCYW